MQLISSRQLTTFSDYRYSPDAPDFLSAKTYYKYLETYSTQFGLEPHIHVNASVTKVKRGEKGGHTVFYGDAGQEYSWNCDAVAVCSGLHATPNIPLIEGVENIPKVIHSSEFKGKEQFGIGKNVLIVGSGETGMDISFMAVKADTKSVTLSHVTAFTSLPKSVRHLKSYVTPNTDIESFSVPHSPYSLA